MIEKIAFISLLAMLFPLNSVYFMVTYWLQVDYKLRIGHLRHSKPKYYHILVFIGAVRGLSLMTIIACDASLMLWVLLFLSQSIHSKVESLNLVLIIFIGR